MRLVFFLFKTFRLGGSLHAARDGNEELRGFFSESKYAGGDMQHYHNQTWGGRTGEFMRCIGIYGQCVHVQQATGVVVVKLSTHPEPAGELFGDMFLGIGSLARGLLGDDPAKL